MTNQDIQNITLESLRDWFKKEKWVRISTSGDIAGPCGTSKNKKNPDRCLPAAKAKSLTKAQRAATARKKKKAGAKGKTVVKNTKAATVKKESQLAEKRAYKILSPKDQAANDAKFDKRMSTLKDLKKGQRLHKAGKISDEDLHNLKVKAGVVSAVKKEGYYSNTQLEDEIRNYGYDSFEQFFADNPGAEEAVFDFIDQNLARMQKETANPQDGKAAPYGSGYKKVTKEDIRNLVVGTIAEMQNESKSYTIDLGNIKSDDLWMIASHLKDAAIGGKTGPISDLVAQAADMLENNQTESLNEKDDRCTRIAKRKYDTWPSAYASGAVVRCRRGEIWKKK